MLNRGDLGLNDSNTPIPFVNGNVTVVIDTEERKPLFSRSNTSDRILWKDWNVIKEALKIPKNEQIRFLKVIEGGGGGALKEHQLSIDHVPNRHLEYIATWYSLASFSFLMSFIRK